MPLIENMLAMHSPPAVVAINILEINLSIISCDDCGKEMSSEAPACPHCGKPNAKIKNTRRVGVLLTIGIALFPYIFSWFTLRSGYSRKARVISFIYLTVVLIVIAANKSGNETAATGTTPSVSAAPLSLPSTSPPSVVQQTILETTAHQIAAAYEQNTVSADQMFKGKKFKVVGTVADINTDLMGAPYVTLKGGINEFMEPQFGFDESSNSRLAKLAKGMHVTMICIGRGDIMKIPMSKECKLVDAQ